MNEQEQVARTIMWQRWQLSPVGEHPADLKTRIYLCRHLDLEEIAKESTRELDVSSLVIYTDTHETLVHSVFAGCYTLQGIWCLFFFFQDGFNFLLQKIFFDQVLDPINFQVDQVVSVTQGFLRLPLHP